MAFQNNKQIKTSCSYFASMWAHLALADASAYFVIIVDIIQHSFWPANSIKFQLRSVFFFSFFLYSSQYIKVSLYPLVELTGAGELLPTLQINLKYW